MDKIRTTSPPRVTHLFEITLFDIAATGQTLPEAALLAAPYLIGDTIKAVLAGLVTQAIARARPAALLSRG